MEKIWGGWNYIDVCILFATVFSTLFFRIICNGCIPFRCQFKWNWLFSFAPIFKFQSNSLQFISIILLVAIASGIFRTCIYINHCTLQNLQTRKSSIKTQTQTKNCDWDEILYNFIWNGTIWMNLLFTFISTKLKAVFHWFDCHLLLIINLFW